MHGRSAHGFTSPGREVGKVFRDTPAARRGALVQPRKLFECEPFIVVKRDRRLARACLEQNDLEALLAELIGEGAAAGTGADNYYDGVVV